jgi:maltooligosyltrehalose trehalohydrolase
MKVTGYEKAKILLLHRWQDESEVVIIYNCGEGKSVLSLPVPVGRWRRRLNSAGVVWGGSDRSIPETLASGGELVIPVAPASAVLLVKEQ